MTISRHELPLLPGSQNSNELTNSETDLWKMLRRVNMSHTVFGRNANKPCMYEHTVLQWWYVSIVEYGVPDIKPFVVKRMMMEPVFMRITWFRFSLKV